MKFKKPPALKGVRDNCNVRRVKPGNLSKPQERKEEVLVRVRCLILRRDVFQIDMKAEEIIRASTILQLSLAELFV